MLGLRHNASGRTIMQRVFQGCYARGRQICYYKPSERKGGDLWIQSYWDPKTKQTRFYDIYGGKLAGILTQSFCRELFFQSLWKLESQLKGVPNVRVIGQFHDEIVMDWRPRKTGGASTEVSLTGATGIMNSAMTTVDTIFSRFPLDAEIKHDYRYIK